MQHALARGQTVVALSSAEAETYAAVSALAEAVHLQSVYTSFGLEVRIQLRLDSRAARAILLRTGPGAVRHLAVRAVGAGPIQVGHCEDAMGERGCQPR